MALSTRPLHLWRQGFRGQRHDHHCLDSFFPNQLPRFRNFDFLLIQLLPPFEFLSDSTQKPYSRFIRSSPAYPRFGAGLG